MACLLYFLGDSSGMMNTQIIHHKKMACIKEKSYYQNKMITSEYNDSKAKRDNLPHSPNAG
jgi:hypothetical protein